MSDGNFQIVIETSQTLHIPGIRMDSSASAPFVTAVDFFASGYRRLPTFKITPDRTSPAKLKHLALNANLCAGLST